MKTLKKMSYCQEVINDMAQKIKAQGFRVFIANKGTYGFYTDKAGSRIISFQVDFLSPSFSGNYKTNMGQNTGTGWRITDNDSGDYRAIFNSWPPYWAVGNSAWKFTNLEQYLKTYQSSSKYLEL